MNKTLKINIDSLDTSIVEMCRSSVRGEAVERYRQSFENAGKKWIFPPLVVWQDGDKNYLLDGHHRLLAVKQFDDVKQVPITLKQYATKAEAVRFALYINTTHGEKLTREELVANIRAYFENGGMLDSDATIARLFGVSRKYISDIRLDRVGMTKKEKAQADVAKFLTDKPDATLTEVAETVGVSRMTARKLRKQFEAGEIKKVEGVVLDCFGREIPQNNLEKRAKIEAKLKTARLALRDLDNAIKGIKEVGGFAYTSEEDMMHNAVAQIHYTLDKRKPDALCTCRGDGCTRCGGVGFLEKTQFNVIIPNTDK